MVHSREDWLSRQFSAAVANLCSLYCFAGESCFWPCGALLRSTDEAFLPFVILQMWLCYGKVGKGQSVALNWAGVALHSSYFKITFYDVIMIVSVFCYLFIELWNLCWVSMSVSVFQSLCLALHVFVSLSASHWFSHSLSFQKLWLCGEQDTSCCLMLCLLFCTSSQRAADVHCSFSAHAHLPLPSFSLSVTYSNTSTYHAFGELPPCELWDQLICYCIHFPESRRSNLSAITRSVGVFQSKRVPQCK